MKIQLQNAKLARANGKPKVHKTFNSILLFSPIIDTTKTTHYLVGNYSLQIQNIKHQV